MRRIMLILGCLVVLTAQVCAQQFPTTFPPQSLYGRLGITSGPGQAIPISSLFAITPTTGNALTITTPSGFSKALSVTQTGAGTDLSGANVLLNDFNITQGINTFSGACSGTCGTGVFGERVAMTTTGASNQGAAVSYLAEGVLQAARTGGQQWTGGGFWTNISTAFSSGGTGTTLANSRGSIIPFFAGAELSNGATNYLSLEGLEIRLAAKTGSSTSIVSGLWLGRGGDAVAGAVTDCAACVVADGVGGQWGYGLQIGDMAASGFQPVAATGTLIGATAASGSPSVAKFIDFSAYTASSMALDFGAAVFQMDGTGNLFTGAANSYAWAGRSRISSSGVGVVMLSNNTATDFTRLQLGGTTTSFPAIARNGTGIDFVLGDGTGHAAVTAAGITGTSASASALAVGLNGATNPAFKVDASPASQAAGLTVVGAATGGTVAILARDSGSNTNLSIDAKGSGTITLGGTSTGGITLSRATAITTSATISDNGIGAASTDGAVLQNTTAAAAGAQQWSPRLHWIAQGWKTNATAASQTVDFIQELVPVQGTTNPIPRLDTSVQVAGGGYTNVASLIYGTAAAMPAQPADATQRFLAIQNSGGRALYGVDAAGAVYAWSLSGATLFGTQSANNVDFYSNNILALSIVNGAALVNEQIYVRATQAATSTSTGGLRVDGGAGVAGALWVGTYLNIVPTVVNSLPSCVAGLDGARAFVTNNNTAVSFGGAVTTGGSTHSPVYCDGAATAWKQG